MAIQDDKTILSKADLKEYHNRILPYLGGNMMMSTNNSDYYSTDEKVVGVWTDGRPVYQKTFDCGALPNSASIVKEIDTNVSNILKIVGSMGFAENTTSHIYLPLNYSGSEASSMGYFVSPSKISLFVGRDRSTFNAYVTLQYTKTTDNASTALTTPGAYNINFPNTWPANKEIFFGNGLYGYRAKGNFTATSTGSSFTLNLVANAANFTIVNTGGSAKVTNSGGSTVMRMFGVNWSQTDTKPTTVILIDRGTNNYLRFQVMFVTDKATTSNTYDVWVTYTK